MLRRLTAVAVAFAIPTAVHADPLDTAQRLYDRQEFEAATGELVATLDKDSTADDATKHRAEVMLGRTLLAMKYPAVALAYLERATDASKSSPLRNAALKWVVAAIESSHGPAEAVLSYRDDTDLDERMDPDSRDVLHFELGRAAAAHKELKDAERELSSVPLSSKVGYRSRFELARVRFHAKDLDGGIKAAEIAARDPDAALPIVRELATWARKLGDPATEVAAMRRIAGGESPAAGFAAFELSRLAIEDTAAVAGLAKLSAGTFTDVITYATCPVIATDDVFVAALPVVREAREAIRGLSSIQDNAEMFDTIRKQKKTLPAVVRSALDEPATRELAEYRDELQHELDQLQATDSSFQSTAAAAAILQELTVQLSVIEAAIGQRFTDRLIAVVAELDQIDRVLRQPVKLAAGPTVTPGVGFIVADTACGVAAATQHKMPVPQTRGCGGAGCSSGGSAGWLVALGLLALRRRRR
jgi:hypothetical protein